MVITAKSDDERSEPTRRSLLGHREWEIPNDDNDALIEPFDSIPEALVGLWANRKLGNFRMGGN